MSFNPTLVRLKRTRPDTQQLKITLFQSYISAIKTTGALTDQTQVQGDFNPTLVRLKRGWLYSSE